ncbi:HIT family protein [Thermovibrio ammonificans]|jgi:ATP adenylyltransferase|uniref:Histidine triad (HIT) protein n=1 Tax=Thermovibrio ammonificans (strain DSM 15698 / JCM 12110 / HB-1) TaxID=648996 RepID=E8T220_THEA1|nr:HIT domain-containing protein [Thermovibrio ammonificans]ADU96915.1 histidine triad (HIT) protein [Thermovibrio ammonificans HB-1]
MELLWAPWRLSYVSKVGKEEPRGCFICRAAAEHPDRDEENLLLYKGEKALVILNRFPYNTGHLMVCPVRHTGDFTSLLPEELLEVNRLIQKSIEVLKRAYNPDGFNVGLNLGRAAGGSVDTHIHFHVVPRWNGDTNFMPVTAGVKVIPQALDETYRRLKECWE